MKNHGDVNRRIKTRVIKSLFKLSQPPVHRIVASCYFLNSFTYWPYPALARSALGMNFSEAELMQ